MTDSNDHIKHAEYSLGSSYKAELEVIAQREIAQASAHALIAIAKELGVIRGLMDGTSEGGYRVGHEVWRMPDEES